MSGFDVSAYPPIGSTSVVAPGGFSNGTSTSHVVAVREVAICGSCHERNAVAHGLCSSCSRALDTWLRRAEPFATLGEVASSKRRR